MRLKIFTAATMKDAMADVRAALGPDAIIVSSRERDHTGRVRVTAALDSDELLPEPKPEPKPMATPAEETLAAVLARHRLETRVSDALHKTMAAIAGEDDTLTLAAALDNNFRFLPFGEALARPFIFIGLPGAGKTVTVAKLAAEAVLAGKSVALISTDTVRSGGLGQLAGYAGLLKLAVIPAADPESLAAAVTEAEVMNHDLVLVDTPGFNPYDPAEVAGLMAAIAAVEGEPVAVAAAGADAEEAADLASFFADAGCRRAILTRLDTARRFGALLSLAHGGPLAFAGVGTSPYIGDGIVPLNPVSLARLLMAEAKPALDVRPLAGPDAFTANSMVTS